MINVIFNDFNYEILPKKLETFEKYCKVLQWGRQHPTRFAEQFMNLQFTDMQKWVFLSSWVPSNIVWLLSRSSGKSYMAAIFLMIRALLFPHTNSYILAPSGSQAQETFTKMENIAKNNIASAVGVTRVFLNETVKYNSKADPFTHNAQSYTVSLYNGSTINTLNSVAKNIVGIRSNFSVYDEAGKIERDFYALTQPFTAQDTNFITGYGINTEIYPIQLPNKTLYLSSAEGIDSELFDQYKLCFNKMLLGDPNYFVADIDYHFSIHPYMNGKPQKPQLNEDVVRNAFETNPYKARREYENIFDRDGGEDVFVKRSTINKYSQPYYPVYQNDGMKKYLIAYDPATKLDNSIVTIAELFRDEERGLMVKFVNCVNLVEILSNGEKAVMQKPKQIERIKDLIVDYNLGALDFENIVEFSIDAGAGGCVLKPPCEEIYIKITL